jgi:hypothetical protein
MADYIGATPQENPLMGLLAERLKQAQQFAAKPFGYSNPPAEMLMNLLGVPAVQQTAERFAYGEPMTTGRGMTTQVRPEVMEAAMTVAPAAGLLGRGVERGAMAAGRAGERYAEKIVPQIMEQGGMPAQLLGDLAQGSRRQIFIGRESPIYNHDAAVKASKMAKDKRSLAEIKLETGMEKSPSGEWIEELSDAESKFKSNFVKQLNDYGVRKQKSVFEHPTAYEAYPDLGDVTIRRDGSKSVADYSGSYNSADDSIELSVPRSKADLEAARSVNLHELQHAIQNREGWAKGGNPEMFQGQKGAELSRDAIAWNKDVEAVAKEFPNEDRGFIESVVVDRYIKGGYPDWLPSPEARSMANLFAKYPEQNEEALNQIKIYGLDKKTTPFTPRQMYENLEGEAMARLVQRRRDLTQDELLKYPAFEPKSEANPYGLDVDIRNLLYLNNDNEIRKSLLD